MQNQIKSNEIKSDPVVLETIMMLFLLKSRDPGDPRDPWDLHEFQEMLQLRDPQLMRKMRKMMEKRESIPMQKIINKHEQKIRLKLLNPINPIFTDVVV